MSRPCRSPLPRSQTLLRRVQVISAGRTARAVAEVSAAYIKSPLPVLAPTALATLLVVTESSGTLSSLVRAPKMDRAIPTAAQAVQRVRAVLNGAARSTTERMAHLLPGQSQAC